MKRGQLEIAQVLLELDMEMAVIEAITQINRAELMQLEKSKKD